ncbi:Predicted membrane protein [Draconibacterium orientale]|uniref:Predicted membrane protein n=1 Tax=Draconibacterium orientale TaxID=1168034 RepID=A0A1I0ARN4_9BACT|nr:DUF2061 domain-containing protein [Draconibacterium orientale]SES97072.1 Predicted membrane protein [Draconibacterium orientale]
MGKENGNTVERKRRSIVKTISWRTIGTIDTILISWMVVGDINFAVTIGGVELFTKMALYFFSRAGMEQNQLRKGYTYTN